MLNAVNLTFVAFGRHAGDVDGQIIVFFVMTVAAAEAAVGLAHRHRAVPAPRVAEPRRVHLAEVVTPCSPLIPLLAVRSASSSTRRSGERLPKARLGRPGVAGDAGLVRRGRHGACGSSPALAGRRRAPIDADALHAGSRRATSTLDADVPVDPLSAVMLLVVTGIGLLIHIYSTGYMHDEVGQRVRALLLLPEPVHRLHAGAGARRELPGDVRRLGGRRALLVPADRLLVQEEVGGRRRQEGVHRQPHRRLRVPPRHVRALRAFGTLDFQRRRLAPSRRCRPRRDVRRCCRSPRCCCSSAPPASRRRSRSTSGCRTRWRARRRSPR